MHTAVVLMVTREWKFMMLLVVLLMMLTIGIVKLDKSEDREIRIFIFMLLIMLKEGW